MDIPLNRLFRKAEKRIIPRSRWQLWGGILLGMIFACIFYYFLFLTRECLRLLSAFHEYEVWRLTDREVRFYNLFMAYLSTILAMAFVIGLWVKISCGRGIRNVSVLTDIRVLNFYFLYWFGEFILACAIMFTPLGGQYVFNLYPDYAFVFVLILIVLFMQCWVTILRMYGRVGIFWMLKVAILVSAYASGLSFIEPINFRDIDQIIDSKNSYVKYDVQLPEVPWYKEIGHRMHLDVYLVERADSAVVIINNEIIAWRDVYAKMNENSCSEWNMKETWLHIDRRVRMENVDRLKQILQANPRVRSRYVVVPENREYNVRYYRDLLLPVRFSPVIEESELLGKQVIVNVLNNEKSIVNGNIILDKQVVRELKQEIQGEIDYCIILKVFGQQRFSEYIRGWSMALQMIDQLRNEYAWRIYRNKFDDLSVERQDSVVRKIPTRVFETWWIK